MIGSIIDLLIECYLHGWQGLCPVLKQADPGPSPSENILSHLFMNRAINISLDASCHVVDIMGDRRVRFKCATGDIQHLYCVRHVRYKYDTHSQSAGTCVVGWEKLRHLASVRLTCMVWYPTYMQSFIISHSSCAEQYVSLCPRTT